MKWLELSGNDDGGLRFGLSIVSVRSNPARDELASASFEFCVSIYKATALFPSTERYGLTSQLRRAASSIAANLAEGYARYRSRQLRLFVDNAFGSAKECDFQLRLARAIGYLAETDYALLDAELTHVSKRLLGLVRALRASS